MGRWALVVLLCVGCQKGPAEATTVILVRHAEKATAPKEDPPLTDAGTARALLLVDVLKGLPVNAVYSTDFARTRATAGPLAAQRGLKVELVDAKAKDHERLVAEAVLRAHRGQTVVVVGHSNTVPGIVAALGAPRPPDICDGEFDHLFVVRVPAEGAATVEHRTYGAHAADPRCAAAMVPP